MLDRNICSDLELIAMASGPHTRVEEYLAQHRMADADTMVAALKIPLTLKELYIRLHQLGKLGASTCITNSVSMCICNRHTYVTVIASDAFIAAAAAAAAAPPEALPGDLTQSSTEAGSQDDDAPPEEDPISRKSELRGGKQHAYHPDDCTDKGSKAAGKISYLYIIPMYAWNVCKIGVTTQPEEDLQQRYSPYYAQDIIPGNEVLEPFYCQITHDDPCSRRSCEQLVHLTFNETRLVKYWFYCRYSI